jgi:uncharacterized radical SAM superfamily protein
MSEKPRLDQLPKESLQEAAVATAQAQEKIMEPQRITICIDVSTPEALARVNLAVEHIQADLDYVVAPYDPKYNFDVATDKIKD